MGGRGSSSGMRQSGNRQAVSSEVSLSANQTRFISEHRSSFEAAVRQTSRASNPEEAYEAASNSRFITTAANHADRNYYSEDFADELTTYVMNQAGFTQKELYDWWETHG